MFEKYTQENSHYIYYFRSKPSSILRAHIISLFFFLFSSSTGLSWRKERQHIWVFHATMAHVSENTQINRYTYIEIQSFLRETNQIK